MTLTAKEAKDGFGRLIDLARAEPVIVAKHGRAVVVVVAVEEFERLKHDLLPESDRADMEFFIEQINLILPVLGFDFTQPTPTLTAGNKSASVNQEHLFEMAAVGVKGEALEADGEFVVLKGSQARLAGTPSWNSYRGLRDKLLKDGKLVESGQPNIVTYADNVAFESPSAAAAVVYAGNQNGRIAWPVKDTGQAYKEWQEGQITTSNSSVVVL